MSSWLSPAPVNAQPPLEPATAARPAPDRASCRPNDRSARGRAISHPDRSVVSAATNAPVTTGVGAPVSPPGPALGPLLPVVGGDLRAPVVSGDPVRYVNLDYAASAPALAAVAARVTEVLPVYSSVHRGAGYASQVSTQLYESARVTVGRFVGARDGDVVVFTRNTTDALNLLAACLPARREDGAAGDVVVLDIEHHANLLPWQRLGYRCVAAASTVEATLESLRRALRAAPATLVALTGASNVTGETLPVAKVARIAHRYGARLVVDAAQLAPHRRIDLGTLGADYVAFSGHKLYAPFGTGALVGRRDWLDEAPAYLAGGGAVREVTTEGVVWADAPARHEGGTPNVLGAVALATACDTIAALPAGALANHEKTLLARLRAGLVNIGGIRELRVWAEHTDQIGVLGFCVDGHDAGRVAAYLSAEHGIGVRDGRFCAHPLLATLAGGEPALRASVGLGSSSADIDRLVTALEQLLRRGARWRYARVSDRWAPTPDPRPRHPSAFPEWAAAVTAGQSGALPCETTTQAGPAVPLTDW